MSKFLVLISTLLIGTAMSAQTLIGRQLVDQYPITSYGTLTYGLTWLPADYNSTTTNYPLIIFLHAAGETGDGVQGLYNLLHLGLPKEIADGWDPQATNPADGKNYKFIVVSPQAPTSSGWSYSYTHVVNILPNVLSRYRVDPRRIYICGISAGGAGTWSCVTNDSNFTKKFAAILPVSSVGVNNPSVEYPNIQYISGKYGVKVWTVCGTQDAYYSTAVNYVNIINTVTPSPTVSAMLTGVPGYGHDTTLWNIVFDQSWRSNAMNVNFYEWLIQYNRDVAAQPENQPPVANAGADKDLVLPANSVQLTGSGYDADGTIAAYQWTKVSGPSQYKIVSPTQPKTVINNLVAGIYQFELKVTDNKYTYRTDTVMITVTSSANKLPVVNAGTDQAITLPVNNTTLTGTASDADGTIAAYQWTKVSGPSQYTIVSPAQAQTAINNLVAGVYQFELKVKDNQGASKADTVAVKVNPPPNKIPIAFAGTDKTINLPADSVLLSGYGYDSDGIIITYQWNKVSGPGQFSIAYPNQASTMVDNLVQGIYKFELKVTDDSGASKTDTAVITVMAAQNKIPVANAGVDQTIALPANSVSLSGTASDTDGTITNYLWTKISGPSQYTISNNAIANPVISNLVAGVYTFRFTVTDNNGATSFDDINITVNASLTGYKTIPAKIEAENYNAMYGVRIENTSDTGGGLDVGWIDNGDWMDYNIYVDSAGIYTVNFRVATSNNGAKFQLKQSDGTVLATMSVPNTASYQTWYTMSTQVTLSQGYQTLRIASVTTLAWNINWLEFIKGVEAATPIPAKIEAESYDTMQGIQMEATADTGGGLDVGWIDNNDWLDYKLNATVAGTYTINLRVATPNSGAKLQVRKADGTVLSTVNIPKTGGYQTWSTVSTSVTLAAGVQTLRIISMSSSGFNFNWMEFISAAQSSQLYAEENSDAEESNTSNKKLSIQVYPNPVYNNFKVDVNSNETGTVIIKIADASGTIVHQIKREKITRQPLQLQVSAYNLPPGLYFVQVELGKWKDSKKILKH